MRKFSNSVLQLDSILFRQCFYLDSFFINFSFYPPKIYFLFFYPFAYNHYKKTYDYKYKRCFSSYCLIIDFISGKIFTFYLCLLCPIAALIKAKKIINEKRYRNEFHCFSSFQEF